ncbi:SIMPL domain-containing protein, partial [Nocardioides sp. T2.26MG-1]
GESDEVMAEARDAAVEEAAVKAQQYAEASGQTLGDVVTLREVRTRPLPTRDIELHGAKAGYGSLDRLAAAMPIRAGRDQGSVTV